MRDDSSFIDCMNRFRAGDAEAADRLFKRFARRLIGLARTRLKDALGCKEDPEEVVQSAYRSFFRRHARGEFNMSCWEDLWGLLTRITLCKCWNRLDFYHADRRDVRREVRLEEDAQTANRCRMLLDREPTPLQAALLTETLEELLRGLDDDEHLILTLSLQGHGIEEISDRVGLAERTVKRVRQLARKRLERMQQAASV
jgi:RNA polymerase sigma-70 factor (ECF subfamily)